MKISIIGTRGYPYVYSGYETFVKEVAERMVQRGHEVTVYCHAGLFSEKPKEVNGIKLVYVRGFHTKSLEQLSHSFLAFMHACIGKTDVILAANPANGPFGLICKLFGKKCAINMDGLEWKRPKWKGLGARYFKFAAKQATRFYDLIINDSEEMRQVYLKEFQTDSEVIAYGAHVKESQYPELIQKWDLQPQGYYLIVGRMVPDNNADLLVKGFIASSSTKKLVIVGDVPYQDTFARSLKAMAEKDDRLVFTGYVTSSDELAELYHQSFAYLHGHEFGGTNPTMLKAMAYGCAIMALDTVFNQEMLQNGKHGLFFSKDENALRQLIHRAEAEPLTISHLKATARQGITKKYTWDFVTDRYLEVLKSLSK
ncbi:DUF1972 domain-containing protein [Penaeicola halotolerans]|uniref:DUF1972 domain-containing protein n=1 Tax=Penaeicola halotolerans TaxID=2793196 RepID=UPI001CF91168|nr:DUF1972 domain-containing protein [Penaeicola halotolerans]